MAPKHSLQAYRHWYAKLIRLYPKVYRKRFGQGMEQTFNDLCRDHRAAERGLFRFALWIFLDTVAGIIRQNLTSMMKSKRIIRIALGTGLILLIPLLGNLFVDGWNWSFSDFFLAGALLFGTGLTYELVIRRGDTTAYRLAAGLAIATSLILFWVNAAVGIIGDGPVNLMYFGVLAIGIVGARIARLEPHGMARTLLTMALAQMLVPVLALAIWNPPFNPGVVPVFVLNGLFATLFVGSAFFFRRASALASNRPLR